MLPELLPKEGFWEATVVKFTAILVIAAGITTLHAIITATRAFIASSLMKRKADASEDRSEKNAQTSAVIRPSLVSPC